MSIFFPEQVQSGRKRSQPVDNGFFDDPYQPPALKRSNLHYQELFEAPSTPESGIDISDLSNQSPNFYSSPREVHEGVVQAMESTSLQPEQSKDGHTLLIVDEPEEVGVLCQASTSSFHNIFPLFLSLSHIHTHTHLSLLCRITALDMRVKVAGDP